MDTITSRRNFRARTRVGTRFAHDRAHHVLGRDRVLALPHDSHGYSPEWIFLEGSMESAEVELVGMFDESPESTNEVPKVSASGLARPGRMATGTIAPPANDQETEWASLVESLLERSEVVEDVAQQVALLHEVASVYEQELGDQESAFYVLQAAFNRDPAHAQTRSELERLAAATNLWHELADHAPR